MHLKDITEAALALDLLKDQVRAYLDIAKSIALGLGDLDRQQHLYQDAVATVVNTVAQVVAHHSEAQNHIVSPLLRLPPEIVVQCAKHLTGPDKVRLSVTCTSVHAAMLGDAHLWTRIEVHPLPRVPQSRREAVQTHMVETFLQRSGSLLFDLEWNHDIPRESGAFSALAGHLHRLRSVRISTRVIGTLERFFSQPLPHLSSFIYQPPSTGWDDGDSPFAKFNVPLQWGGGGAPRLQVLRVRDFTFQSDMKPIPSLREFGCCFGDPNMTRSLIVNLFPALRTLVLLNARFGTLPIRRCIPTSLTGVTIHPKSGWYEPERIAASLRWFPTSFVDHEIHDLPLDKCLLYVQHFCPGLYSLDIRKKIQRIGKFLRSTWIFKISSSDGCYVKLVGDKPKADIWRYLDLSRVESLSTDPHGLSILLQEKVCFPGVNSLTLQLDAGGHWKELEVLILDYSCDSESDDDDDTNSVVSSTGAEACYSASKYTPAVRIPYLSAFDFAVHPSMRLGLKRAQRLAQLIRGLLRLRVVYEASVLDTIRLHLPRSQINIDQTHIDWRTLSDMALEMRIDY